MSKQPAKLTRLRGARPNDLRGFEPGRPLGKLLVITGRSGSGKTSPACDKVLARGRAARSRPARPACARSSAAFPLRLRSEAQTRACGVRANCGVSLPPMAFTA